MNNFEFIIFSPHNPVAFSIFGYPVRYYGLIIAFSLIVGYFCCYNFLKYKVTSEDAEKFSDYSIFLIIFSIIGARLFYVFGQLNFYINNPLEAVMINHGGISVWGAIFFGIISLFVFSKLFRFNFFLHGAILSVFMPLCQAIGRWGNFFNQEAFGIPSQGFLKLYIETAKRPSEYSNYEYFHPAFLYESILDLIIFIILLCFFDKNKPQKTLFSYLILYSSVRIVVELIRIDSVLNFNSVPVAIIISIFAFLIGLGGYICSFRKSPK